MFYLVLRQVFPLQHFQDETRLYAGLHLPLHFTLSSNPYLIKFFLLYIQKLYGSKKVIPKFLLPPNNNYNYAY